MHYIQAQEKITAGIINNVYLLTGEESFLKQSFVQVLASTLGKKGEVVSVEMTDLTPANLAWYINQRSLVATKRLLMLHAVPYQEKGQQASKSMDSIVLAQLKQPEPSVILIFLADKADQRRKTVRAIAEQGGLVEFSPLRGEVLLRFLQDRCRQINMACQKDALEELVFRKGEDLNVLLQELDKLALYLASPVGENKVFLTREAVQKNCLPQRESNIFQLADAVGNQQALRALRLLKLMLQQKEPPPLILFMLARHYRLLYQVLMTPEKKKNPALLARKLRLPSHVAANLIRQASSYTRESLAASFLLLEEADRQMKKGLRSGEASLELLIWRLSLDHKD